LRRRFRPEERRITAPLSAIEVKTRVSPVTRMASLLNTALTVPPPPLKYWQTRHQHCRAVIGASAAIS
jgi:hypothetical protein